MVETGELFTRVRDWIERSFEWLAVYPAGQSFPLDSGEIDIEHAGGRVLIGMPGEKGFRSWRVLTAESDGDEILMNLTGAFGNERTTVRLVPRTPAEELSKNIEMARLLRANEIAALVATGFPAVRVTRVALNEHNGRIAQLTLEAADKSQSAALADVTNTMTPESMLAHAFVWLRNANERRKRPYENVWIIAEKRRARALRKLHALIGRGAKACVRIVEIAEQPGEKALRMLDPVPIASLWREKPRKLSLPAEITTSGIAEMLIDIAPERIDVIRSKQGETLRFNGLSFARVRTMLGKEKAWFGVEKKRNSLTPENFRKAEELCDDLERFRSSDSPNPRHEYYRAASESWLESILKRNIKLLDANLVLSPIYNQFRALSDKIDLLALRRDGRLVIIELKTKPDREMVFQAADYWRKIELHRRRGHLAAVNLFDGREIIDKPALVYAVAPALSFHRDFEFFARMISSEIELWRFELHENWRDEVKVISRIREAG